MTVENDSLDLSASWQRTPATDGDLQLLGLAVRQTAQALGTLASSDEIRRPATGTRAHEWIDSPVNWATSEGSTHVEHALGGVRTACFAASEHMEILVDSVQRGRATVAAWTLTRTVLETLGRVNYLLGGKDALDLLSRQVALIHGEMKHAKHSVHIVKNVGQLEADKYVSDLRAMVKEIGGAVLPAPNYTDLATSILEEAAPGSGARSRYSQLSGVAHGELTALQMFVMNDGLVLPRVLLVEAAHMVCAAAILVGDKVRDAQALLESPTTARWNASRDRARTAAFALHTEDIWRSKVPDVPGAHPRGASAGFAGGPTNS